MDDNVKFVLTILGGAAGASLLALLGAWIQSRREHARWIREKRLDAYLAFLSVVELYREDVLTKASTFTEVVNALTTMHMVGPANVIDAADVLRESITRLRVDKSNEVLEGEWLKARNAFVTVAQVAVGIKL